MRGVLALLDSLQWIRLSRRLGGDYSAAKLQLLQGVFIQQLCTSLADEVNDSTDLIRLRTCSAMTNEVGYEAYQQNTTSN